MSQEAIVILVSIFPKIRRNIFVTKCELRNIDASGHFQNRLTYLLVQISTQTYNWKQQQQQGNVFISSGLNVHGLCNWPLKVRSQDIKINISFLIYKIDEECTKH